MRKVYLDNSSTTPLLPEVREAMIPYLGESFGNPSCLHEWGDSPRDAMEVARTRVAQLIGARAEEVIFTQVASGPNGAYPHHHSGKRPLRDGDAIVIDIGASLNGYKSDITRMAFLGEPPVEFMKAYVIQLESEINAAQSRQKP